MEVESGASTERPVLEEALALCRKHSAALLVQKVDRITRDMEVLARIVKDKQVELRVASLPNADNFQIHLEKSSFICRNVRPSDAREAVRKCLGRLDADVRVCENKRRGIATTYRGFLNSVHYYFLY